MNKVIFSILFFVLGALGMHYQKSAEIKKLSTSYENRIAESQRACGQTLGKEFSRGFETCKIRFKYLSEALNQNKIKRSTR